MTTSHHLRTSMSIFHLQCFPKMMNIKRTTRTTSVVLNVTIVHTLLTTLLILSLPILLQNLTKTTQALKYQESNLPVPNDDDTPNALDIIDRHLFLQPLVYLFYILFIPPYYIIKIHSFNHFIHCLLFSYMIFFFLTIDAVFL